MRGPENIPNSPPSQDNKILKGRDGRLQEIEQTGFLMNPMLPYKVLLFDWKRRGCNTPILPPHRSPMRAGFFVDFLEHAGQNLGIPARYGIGLEDRCVGERSSLALLWGIDFL